MDHQEADFPSVRLRRLRRTPALRDAFTETRLDPADLVLPIFVKDGLEGHQPVASLPGVSQHGVASAVDLAKRAAASGVRSFLLFGIPSVKDPVGSSGWDPAGPVPSATRAIREAMGDDVVLWADVCSCEYTDHGHCGPLDEDGHVLNDEAIYGYLRESLAYAEAGIDIVAPSGMMDGQVAVIRNGLDDAGFGDVAIVAYAAKYASAFYGPFRDVAESQMAAGDRRSHQMAPANRREAIREIDLDVREGADVIMVKPALPYLDVVADAARDHPLPVAAYHVSGEHAMLVAAAERGILDLDAATLEAHVAIKRAGADLVITYAAEHVAGLLARP
jgi:porphobilinogen synthase